MSDHLIETIDIDGYIGQVFLDPYSDNPREAGDYHIAVLTQLGSGFGQPDSFFDTFVVAAWERFRDPVKVERYARAFLDAAVVGWSDDPRSSSRVFGYITNATVAGQEWDTVADAQAALDAELSEYQAWCDGDVYGYGLTDPDGNEIDSCWGYYGDDQLPYIRSCINEAIVVHRSLVAEKRRAMYRRLVNAGH